MSDNTNMEAPSLSATQAAAILQFLQRTNLKGAEVPAFMEVASILSAMAEPAQAQGAAQ